MNDNLKNTMDLTSYLIVGQGYWGQGLSLVEAKDNFRKQGALLSRAHTVVEFPPGVEFLGIDEMGYTRFNFADPDHPVQPTHTDYPIKQKARA